MNILKPDKNSSEYIMSKVKSAMSYYHISRSELPEMWNVSPRTVSNLLNKSPERLTVSQLCSFCKRAKLDVSTLIADF